MEIWMNLIQTGFLEKVYSEALEMRSLQSVTNA